MSVIRDESLFQSGEKKIQWVKAHMPLLNRIEERFIAEKPLDGVRMAISIHLEAKTAYMAHVLRAGGADVRVTGCNPLSTQDDVAAALVHDGFEVFAVHGASADEYTEHLKMTLAAHPHQIIDDGGDLIALLHDGMRGYGDCLWGGAEETTTGVMRLRAREKAGKLDYPMIAVNDAMSKYLFDNRYGTGQSVWDGIMRTTNLLVAGKNVVVAGYGWCGRGISMRAKALGAHVIVCEISPFKAIEAVMDGYKVMPMRQAAGIADIVVTATGCSNVVNEAAIDCMKDGAILCNAGHFDVEVNKKYLGKVCRSVVNVRNNIDCYQMEDGRKLYLLAEGRLVNLAAGDGHPAEIMDTSFATQLLCAEYIAKHHGELKNGVYCVPESLDREVALMKLESMGYSIDKLTQEQKAYLEGDGT